MRAILLGPSFRSRNEARSILRALRLTNADLRIGVDGGTRHWLDLGMIPDLAVGDWDSLGGAKVSALILSSTPHLTLPRDKDRGDLYYAACAAANWGAQRIVAAGVTGGRPDHQLAMLYDLGRIAAGDAGPVAEVTAVGADGSYHFLSPRIRRWKADLRKGSTVSIFALGGAVGGVTLRGFKYPLRAEELICSSRGLSNSTVSRRVSAQILRGNLVVMVPWRAETKR